MSASTPIVSVLVSTYNRPALLEQALRSVLAQQIDGLEVIVLDDCGDVSARDVVTSLSDDRFRYLRNERNMGLAATNWRLFELARGEYIAHLDDDDQWEPMFLVTLVEQLREYPLAGLAFSNHMVINGLGTAQPDLTTYGEDQWGRTGLRPGLHYDGRRVAAIARSVPTSHSAVLRRSTLRLGRLDPAADRAWDMWAACLGVRETGQLVFEPRRLSRYRVHEHQMSGILAPKQATASTFAGLVWCLERLIQDEAFIGEREALRSRLAEQLAYWSFAAAAFGDRKGARARSRRALRLERTALTSCGSLAVPLLCALPPRAADRVLSVAHALHARRRTR